MKATRASAVIILAAALLIAAAAAFTSRRETPPPPRERPKLLILTSLPIVFSEDFSLEAPQLPVRDALERHFELVPISTSSQPELAKGKLLLMAQPRAQRPQDLVALDRWVRAGGRVLLLADPMLEWPSERPLGDLLRPPPMFADTGLLTHWGLRLDGPDERGLTLRTISGKAVLTASPGVLSGDRCRIGTDRLAAECALGRGKAVVLADADILNIADLDGPTENNIAGLLQTLANLSRP